MGNNFPGGVWPVMLTPFTEDNKVDYPGLGALIDWYIDHGVSGLFAVCQSSEMFFLTLEERVQVARFVVEKAAGRVPVIASGHVSDSFEDQVEEIKRVGATGVDAAILITNRMAKEDESDEVWLENLKKLLAALPEDLKLGFYECPYPYKRVLSKEMTEWCAKTNRFYFLKDTCCDIEQIKDKLEVIKGTNLKLYNANTTTLLDSLKAGAAGFSGVMANFHPQLYAWLCDHVEDEGAQDMADFLTIASLIERQYYPVNAKYHLSEIEKLPITTMTRTKDPAGMTDTFRQEVQMLNRLSIAKEKTL